MENRRKEVMIITTDNNIMNESMNQDGRGMRYETPKEQLIRKIIEWTESLTEEEIKEYTKDSEDHPEEQ